MSKTRNLIPTSLRLKILIREDDRPLKHLARDAGVEYQAFRRWYVGTVPTYDVDLAERVYASLTGEAFH